MLIITLVQTQGVEVFSSSVITLPPEVSQKNAELILHIQSSTLIPAGAVIELKLPATKDIAFSASALTTPPRCEMKGAGAAEEIQCSIVKDVLTWTLKQQVVGQNPFSVSAAKVLDNPMTTERTDSLEMRIYTDASKQTLMDYQLLDLGIAATAEAIPDGAAQILPLTEADGGTGEVGKPTKVQFKCKNVVPLPPNTVIIIDFPKFNPEAPRSRRESYFVTPASTICSKVLNVDEKLSCVVDTTTDTDSDRLIISGALPTGLEAGTDITIQIDSMKNPLSMQRRQFATSLAVVGRDKKSHDVQVGFTTYKSTTPTTISKVEIVGGDQTVQEYTEYTVNFTPDVEVEAGAYVMVSFPRSTDGHIAYRFDSTLNSMTTLGGIFGGRQDNVNFAIDAENLKVETKIPTAQFSDSRQATLIISKIKNPPHVGKFESFGIYVYDKDKELIAQINEGVFLETIPGKILKVSISPVSATVYQESMLTLKFYPLHRLEKSSKLKIEISADLKIQCPGNNDRTNDFDYNSWILVSPLAITCSTSTDRLWSIFDVDNSFVEEYHHDDMTAAKLGEFDERKLIRIAFMQSQNPLSAKEIRGLKISTLTDEGLVVDTYDSEQAILFTIEPAPFFKGAVVAEQTETSTESVFKFTFTLANTLLTGAYFEVVIPPEIVLPTLQSALTATAVQNMDTTHTKCSVTKDNVGNIVVKVTDFISQKTALLSPKDQVVFELQNLVTPKTTVSTRSFKVYTKDKDDYLVNYIESDIFVTMFKGKSIPTMQLTSSSYIVGEVASHTLNFMTSIQLSSSDQIIVMYPPETFPPMQNDECVGGEGFGQNIKCSVIQNVVKASQLVFQNGDSIPIGTKLSFTIKNSQNPKSTKPTDIYKFYIQDSFGDVISEMTTAGFPGSTLTMKEPSPIQTFDFNAVDNRQLADTAFELSFTSTMPYPKGAYLVIAIDSSEMGPKDAASQSKVKCSSNLQLIVACKFLASEKDKIKVSGVFIDDIVAQSHISFMITNFFINIKVPRVTNSWVVTVYTPAGDAIDQIKSGLSLEFKCTLPCLTCAEQGQNDLLLVASTICKSCNTITDQIILYQDECIKRCPPRTFYDDSTYTCKNCNANCRECDYNNGNWCTSCDPYGPAPFLDGVVCKAECPFGTYADQDLNKCMPCQAPCQSCNSGPLDCNTCDFKSAKRYFQEGTCLPQCDTGFTVPLDRTDFLCVECDANCASCLIDTKNCMSCKTEGAMFLSQHDNTCRDACPVGITVPTPANEKICEVCAGKCQTCSGTADFCTSCAKEFYLDASAGDCLRDCSEDGSRVALNDKCVDCKSPCATCENSQDYCLTCVAGSVMHEYKCIEKCPDKYEDREGKCVLTGFFCRFGYEYKLDKKGQPGCFLMAQICEGNDTLNYDKTKCIPQPGALIPFPLIFLGLLGTGTIIFDKKKHPKSRFYPNMICMLSVLETIGLICLVGLSNEYGIRPSYSLSACALMFLYGMNLFFALVYFKQIKTDIVFKYWELEYQTSSLSIVSIGALCNFKFFRMFYSRYQDQKNYNAPFQDEQTYYRTLVFTSAFFVITGTVPIIVASCFGLQYVRFGYQLQMFCIEMLIIEVLLLVLQSIELFKIRKYYLGKSIYKIRPKQQEEFVRAAVGEDEDQHENETVALLQKLIQKMNVKDAGKRQGYGTIQEIQDLHDEEFRQHQMRRCISFREIREYQDENDEFQAMINEEDSDDDRAYNFISEPSSPRSKEMLLNPNFRCRMNELSKAYCMRDQYDNCYHEAKPLYMFGSAGRKKVSKAVQTNVLELLGVDDLLPDESKSSEKIEERDLLHEQIDEESGDEHEFLEEAANGMGADLVNNVLQNFEGFQEKKKRKRLPPQRMRQLPKFQVNDLIGQFDIDEDGNYIIISNGRDQRGRDILEDQTGRRVNRRGYYVDDEGSVVTIDGTVVFKAYEVDEDDEIPAPFCYQKNKTSLGLNRDAEPQNLFGPNAIQTTFDSQAVVHEQEDEDDMVDQEYQKLYRADEDGRSERSGDSQDQEHRAAAVAPSKMIKNVGGAQRLYDPNDEDMIEKISQPMRPKPREQLIPTRDRSPIRAERPPRLGAANNLSKIRTDNDNNTSIDAEFMLHGNLGVLNDRSEKSPINVMKSEKSPQMQTFMSSNADIFNTGGQMGNLEDIHVEITKRPNTGHAGGRPQVKHYRKKRQPGASLSNEQLWGGPAVQPKKRDREQDILDGIERFQAMLARYPLKPMAGKASNTLANKNLNKVYGKIKRQFSKNINIPEQPEPNAGGTQTPSQFQPGASRSGLRNPGSIMESAHSQSSVYGGNVNIPRLRSGNTQHSKPAVSRVNAVLPMSQGPLSANDRVKGLAQIYSRDFRNKTSIGKAASNVSRSSIGKMGVLSMAKLHSELNDGGNDHRQLVETDEEGLEQMSEPDSADRNRAAGLDRAAGNASAHEMNVLLLNQTSGTNGTFQKKTQLRKANTNLMQGGYL